MDLIFTNKNREDVGVLHNYEFDLAFGTDENNFECVVGQNDHHCEFGSFLYIEGTEYGGIVDSIKSKNSTKEVVYSGRTWHGIMNSKVLQPDSGQAYLTVTGEANSVVASLVARMGLSDLFEVSTENSGLTVKNYKMNRYINGYDGILKMLKTVGGKLLFRVQNDCQVLLSVAPAVDYTKEELDSDLLDLDVTQTKNTVNHLICLGSGELENRLVIHLYADANGTISQTQTFTGSEEYVAVFDYPNAADEAELVKEGTDRLKELLQQNDISVDVNDVDDPYDIGDLVGASDSVTNLNITVPVAKKIVTIRNGTVTIDIKTETGNISKQSSGGYVGGGGSGEPGESGKGMEPVTTGGTGAAYTATVSHISSLVPGVTFIMVPHTTSTSKAPTLNVNGLGAKVIRRLLLPRNTFEPIAAGWLPANHPVIVKYNGTYWVAVDMARPSALDLDGVVPIANGGTNATTAAAARTNLSVYSKAEVDAAIAASGGGSGEPGAPGEPGYTPQKGIDYWTEEDKAEMVNDVLDALPDGDGVNY